MVPVNLRPPGAELQLGNYFGLVIPALPLATDDPPGGLAKVRRTMQRIKKTPEAFVSFAILQLIGGLSPRLHRLIVSFFAMKTSVVMTNVPGPRERLMLAGTTIDRIMFWVPQAGTIGMGVSIISYADEVSVGVITDAGLVPDPELIVDGIHTAYARLREHASAD